MARDSTADVAGVTVGQGSTVAVMGALNVSPESFYAGSVYRGDEAVLRAARVHGGGGRRRCSTSAPCPPRPIWTAHRRGTRRPTGSVHAVELLAAKLAGARLGRHSRARPARAALEAGARIINDVRGLAGDPELARLVAEAGAGLVAHGLRTRPSWHLSQAARPRRSATRRSPVTVGRDRCSRGTATRARGRHPRPADRRRSRASASSATRRWRGTSGICRCWPGCRRCARSGGPSASACRASRFSARCWTRADPADASPARWPRPPSRSSRRARTDPGPRRGRDA